MKALTAEQAAQIARIQRSEYVAVRPGAVPPSERLGLIERGCIARRAGPGPGMPAGVPWHSVVTADGALALRIYERMLAWSGAEA